MTGKQKYQIILASIIAFAVLAYFVSLMYFTSKGQC